MPAFGFHPIVARWFEKRFGAPTEPQRRGWPPVQAGAHTLIAAPTGSGKTLAAFFAELDRLFREGLQGSLSDSTRVVYVSPLKALSNDIHKNLEEPLAGLRQALLEGVGQDVDVRAEVRTGDTPASRRQAMLRKPPHILVTTPESLYLLLTSESGRKLLGNVRTVIVDEIHALVGNRRGSHLSLTLERLADVVQQPLQRIGLSATQKPIQDVARFLVGDSHCGHPRACHIVDVGHRRALDLAIELPRSPLEAVMSNEVWTDVYSRLAELIEAHRTTLIFVNTRRLAERATHHLAAKLGPERVMSHHGSLSARLRLEAEDRLKRGELKALVATASLELGIDIGSIDLVCQLGPTRSISTLLQRAGRAGHRLGAISKARLFPLSRDELIECLATLRSVREGQLDSVIIPAKPLDVLAQQIVACAALTDWDEHELFDLVRSAYPYHELTRDEFDQVVQMLAEGFSTKRGRRAALIHHDAVNHRIRGRRGARLLALTSGGAIPDTGDYRVLLEPGETFIGTVNEDFAVESLAGDIFQLGSTSWRILRVNAGTVRVEDARGQPPNIPFWLGEAPGRTDEVSRAVSDLLIEAEEEFKSNFNGENGDSLALPESVAREEKATKSDSEAEGNGRLQSLTGFGDLNRDTDERVSAGEDARDPQALVLESQLKQYLVSTYKALGALPSQNTLIIERFFDESGGMQLVIHSRFGIRVNRAWGLALRKRFCRSFNFELQAAATDDAIVLSLGTQHSFPIEEVFRYLNSKTVRDLLVQALLDSPMFPTRWRWNATRALALPRQRGGRKVAAPLQRMEAENLLASVFPDQLACLENIAGDREIPDHPLVKQTIEDCLTEAMDLNGLTRLLRRIEKGTIRCVARDLPEPSPMAHEILHARPYAFLDDAPLEERRTQAVYTRRALSYESSPGNASDFGSLDPSAIETVSTEAFPRATNRDELHDALLVAGMLSEQEIGRIAPEARAWLKTLADEHRAGELCHPAGFWAAAEKWPIIEHAYPGTAAPRDLDVPERSSRTQWDQEGAVRELVRGRLEISGPVRAESLARMLHLSNLQVEAAMLALEREGFVLRGKFQPRAEEIEWCERRLLARIHRLTLNRLRAEIQPVSVADYLRFLTSWQKAAPEQRAEGQEGLWSVLQALDAYELAAAAWEPQVLSLRVKDYSPQWLDQLCLTGRVGWGRLTPPSGRGRPLAPIRSSPISMFVRQHLGDWLLLSPQPGSVAYGPDTVQVLELFGQRGAMFAGELLKQRSLLPSRLEQALAELAAQGRITSDSFEGLRALLLPQEKRIPFADRSRARHYKSVSSIEFAGRWSLLRPEEHGGVALKEGSAMSKQREEAIETYARVLLRRYGVVFRRMLERESLNVSWYELGRVFRRLEARGEIRGGYFVGGIGGEQFALPEAVGLLRAIRKKGATGELLAISAADPLNLVGIITPGKRIAAITSNRIVLRDGVAVAAQEGRQVSHLEPEAPEVTQVIERTLRIGSMPAALKPYYSR